MFLPYLFLVLAMISIQFGASFAKGLFPLTGAAGMSLVRLGFLGTLTDAQIAGTLGRIASDRLHRLCQNLAQHLHAGDRVG